ncbi:hypothetical protein CJ739_2574 [Mariniflexile rhizosphaerae]|uniref:hypothetical protein n=1 Tax=unclassified Mariniflexile TaxID=2643887 RepID=UPI000E330E86|nr:hypothetical protein [Mariniflexile sp. TRM1-10]AXP81647.1 hypothetical protein CJ739_2574 [Mariniflexile sp. TRM1-10]
MKTFIDEVLHYKTVFSSIEVMLRQCCFDNQKLRRRCRLRVSLLIYASTSVKRTGIGITILTKNCTMKDGTRSVQDLKQIFSLNTEQVWHYDKSSWKGFNNLIFIVIGIREFYKVQMTSVFKTIKQYILKSKPKFISKKKTPIMFLGAFLQTC